MSASNTGATRAHCGGHHENRNSHIPSHRSRLLNLLRRLSMKRARFVAGTILAVMCTLFIGSSSVQLFAQGGTWATKAPMPTARFGLGAASVNGVIYAIGGDVSWYGCAATGANEAYN